MRPAQRLSLRVQLTSLTASVPMVVLPARVLGPEAGPLQVTVTHGETSVLAWAWSAAGSHISRRVTLDDEEVGVSRRLAGALQVDPTRTDAAQVTVTTPPFDAYTVRSAKIDDLPGANEVHVHRSDTGPRTRLLTRNGIATWVVAVPRDHVDEGTVRVNYHLRLLTQGAEADDSARVTLAAPAALPTRSSRVEAHQRLRTRLRARLHSVVTALDSAVELLLRLLFRAPELAVRVTQAHPGDDDGPLITLHPALFDRIGIEPGAQVLVRWGSRAVIAPAVADHEPYDPHADDGPGQSVQRTNLFAPALSPQLSPHLVARLSAPARRELGSPAATVVSVRRRLRPLLTSNLNQLVLPVLGLVLAAAALESPNWLLIASAAVGTAGLGLVAALRMPRTPRGSRRVSSRRTSS